MSGTSTIQELADRPETIPDTIASDPVKSRAEIIEVESTRTSQDFIDAINHTRSDDLDLRSRAIDTTDDGTPIYDPAWTADNNDSKLLEFDDEWIYTDGMVKLDALQVVALEEGIISTVDDYPDGSDFHPAVKALRQRGAPIPHYDWKPRSEPVPVLPTPQPTDVSRRGKQSTAETTDNNLTIDRVRDRCRVEIQGAIRRGEPTLIEALPTLGKSYGTILAAAETGEPVTILTCRGQKEQYGQFEDWAEEHDLTSRRLPNFFHECPTVATDGTETEIGRQVREWYNRGADAQTIHEYAADVLGRPLPCQQDSECPYMSAWDFDSSEFDVLLGYYTHAHVPRAILGRTVVLDEFPGDAFETKLDSNLSSAVTHFLGAYEELPFESYTDLLEHRDDRERCETALEWFEGSTESYTHAIFEDDDAYGMTPLAVYTLLTAENLGNGWEYAWPVGDDDRAFDRTGVFDRETGAIYLLESPDLTCARNVIALDGTPTPAMWELALTLPLEHRRVLSDDERRTYLRDVLQHEYILTTEYTKPYNGNGVNLTQDAALLSGIVSQEDEKPGLLTTKTAEDAYADAGLLDLVDDYRHYGDLIGSNTFKKKRLGVVIGSNHYGDDFIEKWSAYAYRAAEREGRGTNLSYGDFGDLVHQHMVEHDTLQAVMRFGRDGGGATVYVHTNTLPEWVPIADEGRLIKAWSPGARQVIEVAAEMDTWRTTELADHPDIGISPKQVRNILHDLVDRGYVEKSREGRGYLWRNTGLRKAMDDVIEVSTVPEIESTTTYRWDFRKTD